MEATKEAETAPPADESNCDTDSVCRKRSGGSAAPCWTPDGVFVHRSGGSAAPCWTPDGVFVHRSGGSAASRGARSLKSSWSKFDPPCFAAELPDSQSEEEEDLRTSLKSFQEENFPLRLNRKEKHSSDISCASLKSDFSRGQPPTFSSDGPDKRREAQADTRDHLTLREVKWTSEDLVEDDLIVDQNLLLVFQKKLKLSLKQKYWPLVEGLKTQTVFLPHQHQLQQKTLEVSDLFLSAPGRGSSPHTVLTSGVAGVGKSVLVQQSIVDWCEGRALQDVHILCPLTFPQLNRLQNQSRSLQELLEVFCPGLSRSGLTDLSHYKVLFILDGLDQCRLRLDFSTRHKRCDAATPMPVETLLSELMKGNLLPDAQLWITSRPGASVPPTLIHRATELHGFTEHQKDRYLLQKVQSLRAGAERLWCGAEK